MIPHITKGGDMRGLVGYLTSTASRDDPRANQHEQPRVVGGDPFLTMVYGGQQLDVDRQLVGDIAAYLERPRETYGVEVQARLWEQGADGSRVAVLGLDGHQATGGQHVWHCSLSLADGESLTDEQWGRLTQGFADRMGLSGADGHAATRWVAIHHGDGKGGHDHVHIAATMVSEDGTKWSPYRDYPRAQQACRALEVEWGLTRIGGAEHGTATRGANPVELGQQQRSGALLLQREELAQRVRASAVASSTEAEWLRRVRADVVVMPRFAEGTTDVVVGYRAALKGTGEQLRFYGGGQLGRDLSLPRLRELWPAPSLEQAGSASAEWQAASRGRSTGVEPAVRTTSPDAARRTLSAYADQLASVPATDRLAWSIAAREVSGALSAWAQVDQQHAAALRQAAQVIGRAGQDRRPSAGPAQRSGGASGFGSALVFAAANGDKPGVAAAALMAQLIRTATALRDYHREVRNLTQASALDVELRRLGTLKWSGYGPEPRDSRKVESVRKRQTRPQQQPQQGPGLALPREPDRPQTAVRYNQREVDRDGER